MARAKQTTYQIAQILSIITSPVTMVGLMIAGVCYKYEISITTFLFTLIPFFSFILAYFVYKVLIKKDSDLDLTKLKTRRYFGIFAFIGFSFSYVLAKQYLPQLDLLFVRAGIIILISGIITTRWKISFHSIGYTSFCCTYVMLFGICSYWLFLLLPVVYCIRLLLKKHTLAQLIAGSVLSLIILL